MHRKRTLLLATIFVLIISSLSFAKLKSDFDDSGDIGIIDLMLLSQHWLDIGVTPCIGDTDDDCDGDMA